MEFPHGHHTHTHHQRREEDEEFEDRRNYPPPPPSSGMGSTFPFDQPPPPPPRPSYFAQNEEFPAPSHVSHVSYEERRNYPPPPPPSGMGMGSPFPFDQPPPPPPPSYFAQNEEFQTPSHVSHVSHVSQGQGPDFNFSANFPHQRQPPLDSSDYHSGVDGGGVRHVAHHLGQNPLPESESHNPHFTSSVHHHTHHSIPSDLSGKPTVKVFCKARPDFSLTIRDANVILAPSDPSDVFQHWYKDEKYSTRVKDGEGCPSFALINKATGQAIKHSFGAAHPVQLIPYVPDVFDESILWTESKDLGDGFRTIRMVNNIRLNVDAFHGDKKSGGVHDGTTIVLWDWNKGDNQRWKIVHY